MHELQGVEYSTGVLAYLLGLKSHGFVLLSVLEPQTSNTNLGRHHEKKWQKSQLPVGGMGTSWVWN